MSDNGKTEKTTKETTTPVLVPRPDGRGALNSGGTPGNKGGGRPPNELRGSMREILEEGLPHLREFVTGERPSAAEVKCPECGEEVLVELKEASPADQLKAMDIVARFGLPKEGYDQDLISELWDATEGALPELDPAIVEKVKKAWVPILARRLMAGG